MTPSRLLITFACLALLGGAAVADVINVPGDYPTIQGAVDAANNGDQIIVAPGTYTSTQDGHVVDMKGKAITLRASGTPEETIIDGENARRGIACFNDETDATVIEGFTITNGNGTWYDYDGDGSEQSWEKDGGGIYCYNSDPTITGCTITGNIAGRDGGGIFCSNSNSTITECTISGNTASDSYARGGGIYCSNNSSPTITDCMIEGNTADFYGGGISFSSSSPTISGCEISGNTANYGGGIYCYGNSSPTITDCTITGNEANNYGGGIHCEYSSPTILDCTITGNSASNGGGIFCNGSSANIILAGTIVCENTPDQVYGSWTDGGGACVAYSCQDNDGDGVPDKCQGSTGDGIHEVPSEYATVQDAINAAGYGDTILVAPGTYTGTGDWVINPMGKPITIRATGSPEETILDGEGLRRVVQCTGGETSSTVIEGLTITGGSAEDGGGIFYYDSNPTLTDCTISGNEANNYGGGIHCEYSSPTITGCTITDNTADIGGGISCYGSSANIILSDTIVCENTTDQIYGSWTDGGGACIAYSCQDNDGDGVPDKCQGSTGDGIHEVPSEYATVQDAINAAGYGDTILVAPGTYTGTGDWVINTLGKPMTIRATGSPEETILDGEGLRGVVQCTGGETSTTVIEGLTITNGNSTYGGGIRCHSSSPTINGCTISGNEANNYGGGIYCEYSSPTITDCTISGNTADYMGGGISCRNNSRPTITNCTISGNTADSGGGILCAYSSPSITGCTISGNTASDSYARGGGIYCSNNSNPTITGCTIEGNEAVIGGGIFCWGVSNPTITDCEISGNTASNNGGGISCYGSKPTITGCTVSGNEASGTTNNSSGFGGGICCAYSSSPTITGCTIEGNEASGTNDYGGGVCCWDNSNPTITGCTVSGNGASGTNGYGGGIYCEQSDPVVTDCTIEGNTASDSGGGIYNSPSSNSILSDTTVCGNDPDQIDGDWTDDGGNTVEDECPACPGDATGDGLVDVNDVLYVLSAWGTDDPNADFDDNGVVNVDDILILLSHFGESCP